MLAPMRPSGLDDERIPCPPSPTRDFSASGIYEVKEQGSGLASPGPPVHNMAGVWDVHAQTSARKHVDMTSRQSTYGNTVLSRPGRPPSAGRPGRRPG